MVTFMIACVTLFYEEDDDVKTEDRLIQKLREQKSIHKKKVVTVNNMLHLSCVHSQASEERKKLKIV